MLGAEAGAARMKKEPEPQKWGGFATLGTSICLESEIFRPGHKNPTQEPENT